MTWLIRALTPIAPSTAENPNSSGTPAATKAPNATSRIAKMIGSDSCSACWKSLPIVLSSAFWALT
jgi:hypothetical protein